MNRQPLEDPASCVDCAGPCIHPTQHRGMDLLAVVVLCAFMLIMGFAIGAMWGGW